MKKYLKKNNVLKTKTEWNHLIKKKERIKCMYRNNVKWKYLLIIVIKNSNKLDVEQQQKKPTTNEQQYFSTSPLISSQ